jgi:uncharacterized protein
MRAKAKTTAPTGLKRLRVLGRCFVYDPQTARHAELDGRTWRGASLPEPAELPAQPSAAGGMPPPGLKGLVLQVSHACNLRCRYCSADFGRYGADFRAMSAQTAERAVDFLFETSSSRDLALTYFGGEPLLNLETVFSSAHYARTRAAKEGRAVALHLVTNGVLLTPRTLFQLDELDFSLTVSLDGPAACHDQARPLADGGGSQRTIARRLEIARELPIGRRITVRGTFTRRNAAFFPHVRYLVEKGFSRNIAFEPVFLPAAHPLALRWRDLPAVKRAYTSLAQYYVRRWRRGEPFCLWDLDDAVTQLAQARPRASRCGAGVSLAAVTAEEELYACHMSTGLPGARLGSLREGLTDHRCRPWRAKYLEGRSGCAACWLRALCGGGCNTHALYYQGGLERPFRLECAWIAQRYRLAMWLLAELPDLKQALAARGAQEGAAAGHLLQAPLWSYAGC